ncbi:MAG: substrate-binding domain-containing protein [Firmicutes bacterium]|nr:substrate-binding domain-containing protein [Bacillota bacterium]
MNDTSSNPGNKLKKAKSRPTIGFLTYGFGGDPVSYLLWSGIYNHAQKKGVDLLCFPGNPPNSPIEFEAGANAVYNLVCTDNLNGLLIWGAGLSVLADSDQVTALYQRFHSIPKVSISLAVPGIPNIGIDNYQGIYELMAHLIQKHGHQRIAFIRGPANHAEANQRYQAYLDALSGFEISFQPSLIYPGNFKKQSGYDAINYLLDQQNCHFEAVLAANDRMAIGALEAFADRGLRVPEEYVVVGFDDIEESKYVNPPLTTSQQPFAEMGAQAVEMLLSLLEGQKIPEYVQLPTKPKFRHSCGCLSPALVQAGAGPGRELYNKNLASNEIAASGKIQVPGANLSSGQEAASPKINGVFETRRKFIVTGLLEAANSSMTNLKPTWAETLFDSFYHDLKINDPEIFIQTLDHFLHQTILTDDDVVIWHGIISTLRRLLLPYLNPEKMAGRAEDLWQQAQVLIGEVAGHTQACHKLNVKRQAERLHQIGQELGASFTLLELINKAAQELPDIGIPSCYLSLYEDQKAEWSRLILAYDQNGRVELDPEGQRFPSHQLVPDGFWSGEQPRAMVVEPLYFHEKQFGFILFEVGPLEGLIYEVLRGELSSTLYRVFLFQERQQAEIDLTQSLKKVKRAMEGAIQSMALAVEMRDPYTAGHQRRVSQLACAIASEMGLPAEQIEGIKLAAIIHDVGKIAIPAEILSKPAKLNEIEFAMIKTHPQIGYDILKTIEFPWPIARIVLQHHRRLDGSGYPPEIEATNILLEAQIIGVADVVEAMSSHRPYRPGLGLEKALQEISQNRGLLYDPLVVEACIGLFLKGRFEFS